jgi:hypothetical protein
MHTSYTNRLSSANKNHTANSNQAHRQPQLMPFTYNNWKMIMLHCSDVARIWGKHQLSEAADFLFLVHWLLSHETRYC